MGVWWMAGRIVSNRSAVRSLRLEVFRQGWQPKVPLSATGASMTSWTRFSRSFISPSTLTLPGAVSRSSRICSAEAKLSRATPS